MKLSLNKNMYRPTWAEVDLSAIEYNFKLAKKLVGDRADILAVVKADAYGHGAVEVAKKLESCGVRYFGVATVPEAMELRQNKVKGSILVMSTFTAQEIPALIKNKITPTVADIGIALKLDRELTRLRKKSPVHVKIDTGMGRIGVWHKQALNFVIRLARLDSLILQGIYSHFPSADADEKFTASQIRLFKRLIDGLKEKGISIPLKHMANSAALTRHEQSYFNLVRPGLMLYGLYPDNKAKKNVKLKPALSLKSRIAYLKQVEAGRSVSYNRTYIARKKTNIATIPVGYADGYNRLLSNRADVLIRGKRCPVAGRVCMDHTMVDVSKVKARLGDEVVLIGRQKNSRISAEEISQWCSTISYEVVCWISQRVPRRYID